MDPIVYLDIFNYSKLTAAIYIICMIYSLSMVIMDLIVILHAAKKKFNSKLSEFWASWIQIHAMFIFYPFFSGAVMIVSNDIRIFTDNAMNAFARGFSNVLIIINVFYAIMGGMVVYNILPTKDYYAATNRFELSTIILQKILLCALINSFKMSTGLAWVLIVFNFLISIIRRFHFSNTLPVYNFKFLRYVSNLVTLSLMHSFLIAICFILQQVHGSTNPHAVIFCSILLAPPLMKFDCTRIDKLLDEMIFKDNSNLTEVTAVHKIELLRHFTKNRVIPNQHNKKMNFDFFYHTLIKNNINYVFGMNNDDNHKIKDKAEGRRVILCFLEMAAKAGLSPYIKLFLAYWHIKKMGHYAQGILILTELEKTPISKLIRIAILYLEELIFQEVTKNKLESTFNLKYYLKNFNIRNGLKDLMCDQSNV